MDWLLQHLELVVPLALVLLYVFNQVMSQREQVEEREEPASEEARRIQEEIRRKIIARQQGRETEDGPSYRESPPPVRREAVFPSGGQRQSSEKQPATPPPLKQENFRSRREESTQPLTRGPRAKHDIATAAASAAAGRNYDEELRIQRQRLAEARQARETALKRTGSDRSRKIVQAAVPMVASGDVRGDLATASALRRAFVLKEILDRPAALRQEPIGSGDWT